MRLDASKAHHQGSPGALLADLWHHLAKRLTAYGFCDMGHLSLSLLLRQTDTPVDSGAIEHAPIAPQRLGKILGLKRPNPDLPAK